MTLIIIRTPETPTPFFLWEPKDDLSVIRHVELIIGDIPLLGDLVLMTCDTCLGSGQLPRNYGACTFFTTVSSLLKRLSLRRSETHCVTRQTYSSRITSFLVVTLQSCH